MTRCTQKSTLQHVPKKSPPGPLKPAPPAPRLGCSFYKTSAGNEPVREWLLGLPADVRKEIGADILRVQWQWPVGPPLVDGSFGGGLAEVRSSFDRNDYRVLFCISGGDMVLLHGFMKQTRATPKADKELAQARQADVVAEEKRVKSPKKK